MKLLGTLLFYVLWPAVWFYAPITRRTRVVVIQKGRILLVKNWFGPGVWQLPGGGIKLGESAVTAGDRELFEELGLKSKKSRELHENVIVLRQFGLLMRYHFVEVSLQNPTKELSLSSELSFATWVSLDELSNISPEVSRGIKLVSNS